jgi:hypothetical protein
MRQASGILYPHAGCNSPDAEHISLPLHIKGIDDWTRQFISDEWVSEQHARMMEEIAVSDKPIFISSERLAGLSELQIEKLKKTFTGYNIEIIVVIRDRMRYLDSTWRHAVFRHDYAGGWDAFVSRMKSFRFEEIVPLYEAHFPVHIFNLDAPDFSEQVSELTGAQLCFGAANIGVPRRLAELLQAQHELLGSKVYTEIFTSEVKNRMLFAATRTNQPKLDPFNVPLF